MRELPILFSTPMVQAILENRKTMTRRIVSKDSTINQPEIQLQCMTDNDCFAHFGAENSGQSIAGIVSPYRDWETDRKSVV